MQLKLSDDIKYCNARMVTLTEQMNDYQMLVSCIRAIQAVEQTPQQYQYSDDDYKKVVDKIYLLCKKHELALPESVESWGSVEIV